MRLEVDTIRNIIKEKTKKRIKGNESLVILSLGDNQASEVYMRNKVKYGEELGIKTEHIVCKCEEDLEFKINCCNINPNVTGIIVQLPLPKGVDERKYIDMIDVTKDVDMITEKNKARMFLGKTKMLPATATTCKQLIMREFDEKIEGLDVVLIGRSDLCCKPLSSYLTNKNCTVTLCHSKTKNIEEKCKNADVIVVAVGKMDFITKNHISSKTKLVIDVGINRNEFGKIQGDVSKEVHEIVKCTPWVKGTGALTVPNLFLNLVNM
ncbi:MAG: tetrahydrofolate dehydrogenase/cyclohydrolase catalytic domain-containing protein [Sarcina sp.]